MEAAQLVVESKPESQQDPTDSCNSNSQEIIDVVSTDQSSNESNLPTKEENVADTKDSVDLAQPEEVKAPETAAESQDGNSSKPKSKAKKLSKEEEEKMMEEYNKKTESLISQAVALKEEGNAFFKAGDLKKARSKYTRVFAFTRSLVTKQNEDSMVNMVQKGMGKGEISSEIKTTVRDLERDVYSNMAMVFLKEQNYSKAIEKASLSLEIAETGKALFRRGKAYAMKNDFESAYKDFTKGRTLEGEDAKVWDEEIERTKKREKEYDKKTSKAYAGFFK